MTKEKKPVLQKFSVSYIYKGYDIISASIVVEHKLTGTSFNGKRGTLSLSLSLCDIQNMSHTRPGDVPYPVYGYLAAHSHSVLNLN